MKKLMPVMSRFAKTREKQQYVSFDHLDNNHAISHHGQSLDRLAERGGMCTAEILANIDGVSPFDYVKRDVHNMDEELTKYLYRIRHE